MIQANVDKLGKGNSMILNEGGWKVVCGFWSTYPLLAEQTTRTARKRA